MHTKIFWKQAKDFKIESCRTGKVQNRAVNLKRWGKAPEIPTFSFLTFIYCINLQNSNDFKKNIPPYYKILQKSLKG